MGASSPHSVFAHFRAGAVRPRRRVAWSPPFAQHDTSGARVRAIVSTSLPHGVDTRLGVVWDSSTCRGAEGATWGLEVFWDSSTRRWAEGAARAVDASTENLSRSLRSVSRPPRPIVWRPLALLRCRSRQVARNCRSRSISRTRLLNQKPNLPWSPTWRCEHTDDGGCPPTDGYGDSRSQSPEDDATLPTPLAWPSSRCRPCAWSTVGVRAALVSVQTAEVALLRHRMGAKSP